MNAPLLATLLLTAGFLGGCNTSSDRATDTLRKSGYSNIQTGSTKWFACSDNDLTGRRFTATNPVGVEVEGVVCCGLFKGCTVRF